MEIIGYLVYPRLDSLSEFKKEFVDFTTIHDVFSSREEAIDLIESRNEETKSCVVVLRFEDSKEIMDAISCVISGTKKCKFKVKALRVITIEEVPDYM